ncbi:MAG: hypothetical protein R2795_22400 [Saprospiraceae bacterium]
MKKISTTFSPIDANQSNAFYFRDIWMRVATSLVLLMFLVTGIGNAQPSGIFTGGGAVDPYPPVSDEAACVQYTDPGSTVSVWDWRAEAFEVVFYPGNETSPSTRMVQSPFYAYFTNTSHLSLLSAGVADVEPADGWELLFHRLGTSEIPAEEPSFGLYNRLDGRIRIFFYIEPNDGEAPDEVIIQLRHLMELDNVSGLFEHLNIPANALENFGRMTSLGVAQMNVGEAGSTWYMLELVASYDPCVCQNVSLLQARPVLNDNAQLTFSQEGSDASFEEVSGNRASFAYIDRFAGTLGAGYFPYPNVDAYIEEAAKVENLVQVMTSLLPSWCQSDTYTTNILEFLVGRGPNITGYNRNVTAASNGAVAGSNAYQSVVFYTPGSYHDAYQVLNHRPVYDNPLGVFTVLEMPIIERYDDELTEMEASGEYERKKIVKYRYKGDLKYHVNTFAGLQRQPVELLGALVWTDCKGSNFNDGFYATPLMNLTCLEDYTVTFDWIEQFHVNPINEGWEVSVIDENYCETPPQLQLLAVLGTEEGGQETVFSSRYQTKVAYSTAGRDWGNPFEGIDLDVMALACDQPSG